MLSSDVADKGFVLLCCGRPESDCSVATVDEVRQQRVPCADAERCLTLGTRVSLAQEELLAEQMHSGAL